MSAANFEAFNTTRRKIIAPHVAVADTALTRMRGLLGRLNLPESEGLWIVPCPMIHTLFMQFPIDALFLARDMKVLKIFEALKPWRMTPPVLGAHTVLELAAGASRGRAAVGDVISVRPHAS